MWHHKTDLLDQNTIKISLYTDEETPLSMTAVIDLWRQEEDFRMYYNNLLADSSIDSFYWEHPPLTGKTLDKPYEFVLVQSPTLNRLRPDPRPFREHFDSGKSVVAFPNLGGDARLVVPTPVEREAIYPHLAPFVREAPKQQIDVFWQTIGEEFHEAISAKKKWLSTAGLGVSWLHARIDSRPKYYSHRPYKSGE